MGEKRAGNGIALKWTKEGGKGQRDALTEIARTGHRESEPENPERPDRYANPEPCGEEGGRAK